MEIIRLIGDFNSLCSFGGSNFNTPICVGTLMSAVVMFRYMHVTLGRQRVRSHSPFAAFHDCGREISYRAYTPSSCAYPMAHLGRFYAAVAIATGME